MRVIFGGDRAFEHDGAPTLLVIEKLIEQVAAALREVEDVLGSDDDLTRERQHRAALLALVVHRRSEVPAALRARMDALVASRRAPSPFCIVSGATL